ncbi:hypothetical protein MAR_035222 [Mya arenaria]|uniref:Uncharacterized protein n=1 Tax=Mya arenaria TaxID=6604 RepID=A0ABY7EN44_MYAAR|nr:hypothetical protein MAR_035222 [Mya arenaria]
MATGRARMKKDYKSLDLNLKVKINPQPQKEVLKEANSILRSILQLEHKKFEDYINKHCRQKIVSITKVLVDEKWHGTIETVIKSREALNDLFFLFKGPQDKKLKNKFTIVLSEYFSKDYLNKRCAFPPQTNITFNVYLPYNRYKNAEEFFMEEENKVKESEAASEMIGSIRRCSITQTEEDETTVDEGSVLHAGVGNIELFQHRFIVAAPKGNTCLKIYVKSSEISELSGALKQYSDCPEMFYTDVVLPADAYGCYEYEFLMKGIVKNITKQSQPFILANTSIHRDIHDPKTCILIHLRHIICSTEESNLIDTCIQIEDVWMSDNTIATDAIPELLQCQEKLSSIGNLKLVITIGFIKKDSLESLNTIINSTQAKLFIAPLLKKCLQQLPASCAQYMPFTCFKLYMIAIGNDLSICRFLFDFYHFFDDNAMIDIVTLLSSKHCQIALEDDLHIIVDLCQKLSVSRSSALDKIQDQLFTTIKLPMGIKIYKKLLTKKVFEYGGDTMYKINSVLQTRFQQNFISSQSHLNLHLALVFAEMLIESNANDALNLNSDIEQTFLQILTKISDIWNNDDMKLKDCVLNQSLFVNERTQLQLLEQLSSSEIIPVRGLFIELATETKFKIAFENLPVKAFQSYIECEMAACGKRGKREKVNGNIEAFINVLKMPCMQSDPTRLDKLVDGNEMLLYKSTIDDVLGTVLNIENICTDDHIIELYKRRIQMELKQRCHDPAKLLQMLFGNPRHIYVKTR